MDIVFVFLISSIVVAFVFLFLKRRELKHGNSVLKKISDKLDPHVLAMEQKSEILFHSASSHVPLFFTAFKHIIARGVLFIIHIFSRLLHKTSNRIQNNLPRRKVGATSFYLKNVSAHRDKMFDK